ncbi:MAG TPA: prepilin-type N-terminal cleavage/methylation domain-containing protein [Frateuria sp.]|uniref:prepilin-type N-terminal cleavage/methylation domain-containing protein n=1 Tax=Frateuria sp. TaxID=2211372 RepID=UPI002D7ED704|nr:prepilin-type N-terminal cleavage/methylation domain-containing protein [Frateuria sp.]HET6805378.1 prepilin-type N-terminal cleavage/methylation domain-containing protein [Frateuria sp.]
MSNRRIQGSRQPAAGRRRRGRGFSLIELMIAMVLGLVVTAGAISVFVASRRTYQANEGLSGVQENARIAFELMARDLRQAGLTGCNTNGRLANVLNNGPNGPAYDPAVDWFLNWDNAVHGYDAGQDDPAVVTGTAERQRVAGTDSVQLVGAKGLGLSVAETPSGPAANFKLSATTSDIVDGDIVVVCDPDHAAVVQVTVQNGSNVTLVHNNGSTVSPGNCSKGLGFPTVCTTNGNEYTFDRNSAISKMVATDWYIGNNADGGRSLYRIAMINQAGVPTTQAQEMVRDVTNLQVQYHPKGGADFVDAASGPAWTSVDAVRVTLTLQSTDKRAGTGFAPIQRSFTSTTVLRNRTN